jgi:hypothetical protein
MDGIWNRRIIPGKTHMNAGAAFVTAPVFAYRSEPTDVSAAILRGMYAEIHDHISFRRKIHGPWIGSGVNRGVPNLRIDKRYTIPSLGDQPEGIIPQGIRCRCRQAGGRAGARSKGDLQIRPPFLPGFILPSVRILVVEHPAGIRAGVPAQTRFAAGRVEAARVAAGVVDPEQRPERVPVPVARVGRSRLGRRERDGLQCGMRSSFSGA